MCMYCSSNKPLNYTGERETGMLFNGWWIMKCPYCGAEFMTAKAPTGKQLKVIRNDNRQN